MSLTNLSAPEFTDAELAELSARFGTWSASACHSGSSWRATVMILRFRP